MRTDCYLIVEGKPHRFVANRIEPGKVRLTKKKPSLGRHEIAIRLDLVLPDSLFVKPTIEAMVKLPADAMIGTEVSAEVQEQIVEAVHDACGIQLFVIAPPEDNEDEQ